MIRNTKHKKVVLAFFDGADIQFLNPSNIWARADTPSFREDVEYRVKPKVRIIDMDKFNVDKAPCLFSNDCYVWDMQLYNLKPIRHPYMRPVENVWYVNHGYDQSPVPEGLEVTIVSRFGVTKFAPASAHRWDTRQRSSDDIIAFKIEGPLDGWAYKEPTD